MCEVEQFIVNCAVRIQLPYVLYLISLNQEERNTISIVLYEFCYTGNVVNTLLWPISRQQLAQAMPGTSHGRVRRYGITNCLEVRHIMSSCCNNTTPRQPCFEFALQIRKRFATIWHDFHPSKQILRDYTTKWQTAYQGMAVHGFRGLFGSRGDGVTGSA